MKYEFSKMHGAGNDFVMIEDMSDRISFTQEQVAFICDRHFGIGGDGVIIVKPSPRPECAAYMDYYNSDGTKAQMCGNGVRCFAKFLVDHGIVDGSAGSFVADTLSGPKPIEFELASDGTLAQATVDMGAPILDPAQIPTTLSGHDTPFGVIASGNVLPSLGDEVTLTCVSMGNPHAVTFVDNPKTYPVETVGPEIETYSVFPEYTNVEFVHAEGDSIDMRVWERGCGETLACGTGACATVVAAHITGRTGRKVMVNLPGGTLCIDWRAEDGHVYLTGPAQESFTGNFEL